MARVCRTTSGVWWREKEFTRSVAKNQGVWGVQGRHLGVLAGLVLLREVGIARHCGGDKEIWREKRRRALVERKKYMKGESVNDMPYGIRCEIGG